MAFPSCRLALSCAESRCPYTSAGMAGACRSLKPSGVREYSGLPLAMSSLTKEENSSPLRLIMFSRKTGCPLRSASLSSGVSWTEQIGELAYTFGEKALLAKSDNNTYIDQPHFIYIPPREMFSLFEGFISLYEKREISFDETYLDLAKAMDAAPLKNEALKKVQNMLAPVLKKWNISVLRKGNRFYIIDDGKEYEAHLVAEGLRKMATLLYLSINGELKPGSILFWDEPESNMNPTLISIIVDLLIELAGKYEVQIFVSTHDYLLSHKLSMMAEYAPEESPEMRFFSLCKTEHKVTSEVADKLIDISHNPILEEYSAFFDLENEYMNRYHERV